MILSSKVSDRSGKEVELPLIGMHVSDVDSAAGYSFSVVSAGTEYTFQCADTVVIHNWVIALRQWQYFTLVDNSSPRGGQYRAKWTSQHVCDSIAPRLSADKLLTGEARQQLQSLCCTMDGRAVQALAAAVVAGLEAEPDDATAVPAASVQEHQSSQALVDQMLVATPAAEAGTVDSTKAAMIEFAQRLGEAGSAHELLYDTHGSQTAAASEPQEDEGRCTQHFLSVAQECSVDKFTTRPADGKVVYAIRTRNVEHNTASAQLAQSIVALSWTELQQLRNFSTTLGDKKFRQAVPECKDPPAFPATYSFVFSTQPTQRLEELKRFFAEWNNWNSRMRTEHGFVITGVCGFRQMLNGGLTDWN
jgi:hypothetical protein